MVPTKVLVRKTRVNSQSSKNQQKTENLRIWETGSVGPRAANVVFECSEAELVSEAGDSQRAALLQARPVSTDALWLCAGAVLKTVKVCCLLTQTEDSKSGLRALVNRFGE